MKFSSSTAFSLLTAAASANAFVPSSSTFANRQVASTLSKDAAAILQVHRPRLSSTNLGVSSIDGFDGVGVSLLKELDDLDDFDPDEDDEEKSAQVLDVVIKSLEFLDGVKHSDLEADLEPEAPVSRRSVTTEYTDTEEEVEKADDTKGGETSRVSFGPAIKLLKTLRTQRQKREKIGYATYSRHPSYPDVDLSGAMKMMDGAPPINHFFSARKFARVIRRLLQTMIAYERGLEADIDNAKTKELAYEVGFTKAKLMGMFPNPLDLLPKPKHVIKHWEEDKEFARQFFAGVNPVMIQAAKDVGQLSSNIVEHFGKDTLQVLVDHKRLLFVSYDDIAELGVNPHQAYPLPMNSDRPQNQERYCYAPIVAFELDHEREELSVLGIQLERTPDAKVYTKKNTGENEWLFVKSCVATADSNMHEWVSHLANTHLTMEPHIIAIHNVLRKAKHPLYTFLKPLCKDTLFLNWGARMSLASFSEEAFGDIHSSVGVGQFMQLIGKMWSRYDFFEKSALPNELANRGFDEDFDVPGYLFREDGMKLWNAYGDFAKDFVDEVYQDDKEVAADPVLQEWAIETVDASKGAVPGFPGSFHDKETLVSVMQTLMWMTSGLHAAVNFPQYDFYAYAPNKPLGMRASLDHLPEKDEDIREWMFNDFFPHVSSGEEWLKTSTLFKLDAALDSTVMVRVLTLPSETCIDNLDKQFSKIGTEAYEKFKKNCDDIGDVIEDRNKASKRAGKGVYYYMNPSVVPTSIDI